MAFDPLLLAPAPESLWLDFQSGRRMPAAGAMPERSGAVLERWLRSRALGAPYQGPRPEDALLRGAALRARREPLEPLIRHGQGVIERVAQVAAEHDYTLLVSDLDGVIVEARGGGAFAEEARRVRLMAGADWSERRRGTNAIGSAIAERRPVFVHGSAHFARDYHGLVCYAAPVYGAEGELVAVLDATSVADRTEESVGFGVVAAALALEEVLRAEAYSRAGATVSRALARSLERMHCPVALVEPPGQIRRLNRTARELFAGASVGSDLRTLFGKSFEEMAALAQEGSSEPIELPVARASASGGLRASRRHRLRAEPIESEGRLIALLLFLEPIAASVSASRPREVDRLAFGRASEDPFAELFAEDPALLESLMWAKRIAQSSIPLMLLAETGSGKELVARGVHRASPRADGPFVPVNCGSIAPSLLESELFGYAPGAFTGAGRAGREGYLAAATGGTLFLDEVAEMPRAMQASLLRFLESGTYRRLGETPLCRADVRVICATCRDLSEMMKRGEFREDLYYRLKGAAITLPPLRARSDRLSLARHLLASVAERAGRPRAPALSEAVEAVILSHPWPGNVRELKSALDVALVLAGDDPVIELFHLPPDLRPAGAPPSPQARSLRPDPAPTAPVEEGLEEVEGWMLRRVLDEVKGNVSRAARRLGVARSTLYRMMRRHGVRKDSG